MDANWFAAKHYGCLRTLRHVAALSLFFACMCHAIHHEVDVVGCLFDMSVFDCSADIFANNEIRPLANAALWSMVGFVEANRALHWCHHHVNRHFVGVCILVGVGSSSANKRDYLSVTRLRSSFRVLRFWCHQCPRHPHRAAQGGAWREPRLRPSESGSAMTRGMTEPSAPSRGFFFSAGFPAHALLTLRDISFSSVFDGPSVYPFVCGGGGA